MRIIAKMLVPYKGVRYVLVKYENGNLDIFTENEFYSMYSPDHYANMSASGISKRDVNQMISVLQDNQGEKKEGCFERIKMIFWGFIGILIILWIIIQLFQNM